MSYSYIVVDTIAEIFSSHLSKEYFIICFAKSKEFALLVYAIAGLLDCCGCSFIMKLIIDAIAQNAISTIHMVV